MGYIGKRSRPKNAVAEARDYAIDLYDREAKDQIRKGHTFRAFWAWTAKQLAKAAPESWEELAFDIATAGSGGAMSKGLKYAGKKLGAKAGGEAMIWAGEQWGSKAATYGYRVPSKFRRYGGRVLEESGDPGLLGRIADEYETRGPAPEKYGYGELTRRTNEDVTRRIRAPEQRKKLARDASDAEDQAYNARRRAELDASGARASAKEEHGRLLGKREGKLGFTFTDYDHPGVEEKPGSKKFEGTVVEWHKGGKSRHAGGFDPSAPYIPGKASRDYWALPLAERKRVDEQVDKEFARITGITRKLDPGNPREIRDLRTWLNLRDRRIIGDSAAAHSRPPAGGYIKDYDVLMRDPYYKKISIPPPRTSVPGMLDFEKRIRSWGTGYRG